MNKQDWLSLCDITNYENELSQLILSQPLDTTQSCDLAIGCMLLQTLVLPMWSNANNYIVRGN